MDNVFDGQTSLLEGVESGAIHGTFDRHAVFVTIQNFPHFVQIPVFGNKCVGLAGTDQTNLEFFPGIALVPDGGGVSLAGEPARVPHQILESIALNGFKNAFALHFPYEFHPGLVGINHDDVLILERDVVFPVGIHDEFVKVEFGHDVIVADHLDFAKGAVFGGATRGVKGIESSG